MAVGPAPVARLLAAVSLLTLLALGCTSHHDQAPAGTSARAPATSVPAASIPLDRSTQSMSVAGTPRTVHLYRPPGLRGAVPLVLMLHGGYGSGVQAEDSYHWDAEANRGRFLLALPDALNASWNAGGSCCGPSARLNVDDVGFLTRLVASLREQADIDPARIFVSGISNGGVMAYRMACETALFAAVGVDSATMLVPCTGARPASVLHIHGTADPVIPYQGGTGRAYSLKGYAITTPPIPSVVARWRAIDGCPAPTSSTSGPGGTVTTSTARCPGGRTVELITIAGAGHQWPGGTPNPRAEQLFHTGLPSTALDATQTIWQFFAGVPG